METLDALIMFVIIVMDSSSHRRSPQLKEKRFSRVSTWNGESRTQVSDRVFRRIIG